MRCPVDNQKFCARHQVQHIGRLYELSQMDNKLGVKYRNLWDGMHGIHAPLADGGTGTTEPGVAVIQPTRTLIGRMNCIHLGVVEQKADCDCPLKHIRKCAKFGKCTLAGNQLGVPSCSGCESYIEDSVIKPLY